MKSEQSDNYKILQPFLLSACIAVGMMVGFKMNDKPENSLININESPSDHVKMVGRVEDLIRFIENKYVDEINSDQITEVAISAIFEELDPHSIYLSPSKVVDVSEQMSGTFNGIGIENFVMQDTVNIMKVVKGSPAELAGLKTFDKIISINDSIVAGNDTPFSAIRNMLKQDRGTTMQMGIWRNGQINNVDVTIDEIPIPTVSSFELPEIEAAYIKVDRFGSKTYQEFMDEIEKYFVNKRSIENGDKKTKHVIIDLRDNPGGYLPEATNILGQLFEEKGKLMVYTEGRNNKKNEYKTIGEQFFVIDQVVVLINENSASASEIIAGAIQDWDRGMVIGRRSFGKGLVQEQYDLNNGGAIRLTVARYYTPSGRSIQRDYTNKAYYDDDFYERYYNGDLFYKDSILIKDTVKYFTIELKRPVKAAGGITPDIFIPLDDMYKNESIWSAEGYISTFNFRYAATHQTLLPKDQNSFEKWSLPEAYFTEFKAFLGKEDIAIDIKEADLKRLNMKIKNDMKLLLFNQDQYSMDMLKTDPIFLRAIQVLKNKEKLR